MNPFVNIEFTYRADEDGSRQLGQDLTEWLYQLAKDSGENQWSQLADALTDAITDFLESPYLALPPEHDDGQALDSDPEPDEPVIEEFSVPIPGDPDYDNP